MPLLTGASLALCDGLMVGMRENADSCDRIVGIGTPFPSLPAREDAMLRGDRIEADLKHPCTAVSGNVPALSAVPEKAPRA